MTEKETIDIEALVQNNPLTRLTSDHGSKIIQKIRERFSPEEQQFYVANLYCYLNYNSKTDFVIILDRIWKWLGYSRVDHCKTCLIKYFKEDVDYKIDKTSFPEDAGKPNLGGRPAEYITLTVNCFKKLCLKSRTEKADQIHDYFIGLEEMMNELVTEQTQELQQKLLIEKEKVYKLTGKKIRESPKGDFIYIYSSHPNEDTYKIGSTMNLNERESTFWCSNPFGEFVYERYCPGSIIVEKTIHLMLSKYRITDKREHFKGLIEYFIKKIDKIIDLVYETNPEIITTHNIKIHSDAELKVGSIQQFIQERCEIGDTFICIKKEIPAAYKIWSKDNNKEKLKDVQTYFEKTFKQGKHFFKDYENSTLAVYKGIRLKEIQLDHKNDFDNFLAKCCKFGPLNRIDVITLENEYTKYKKTKSSSNELVNLKKYLSNHQFIFNNYVMLNTHHVDGYWGIQLKNNENNYGVKVSKNRRKNIICIKDEEILNFGSLTEASKYFKVGIPSITLDIKLSRTRDGFVIKYESEIN